MLSHNSAKTYPFYSVDSLNALLYKMNYIYSDEKYNLNQVISVAAALSSSLQRLLGIHCRVPDCCSHCPHSTLQLQKCDLMPWSCSHGFAAELRYFSEKYFKLKNI